jgi:hypothetical protein
MWASITGTTTGCKEFCDNDGSAESRVAGLISKACQQYRGNRVRELYSICTSIFSASTTLAKNYVNAGSPSEDLSSSRGSAAAESTVPPTTQPPTTQSPVKPQAPATQPLPGGSANIIPPAEENGVTTPDDTVSDVASPVAPEESIIGDEVNDNARPKSVLEQAREEAHRAAQLSREADEL